MKCPECGNELTMDNIVRSAPVETPLENRRHFHIRCGGCGETAWYTAELGHVEAKPRTGPHDCAFFRPQAP